MSEEEQKAKKKSTKKGDDIPKRTAKKNAATEKKPRVNPRHRKKAEESSESTPLFSGIHEPNADFTVGAVPTSLDAFRYIQVEKGNLLTYLAYGLIYPVNLEDRDIVRTQSRAQDPQSLFPDALVFSQGYFKSAEEDQVLIEVTLSQEEANLLIGAGVFRLLPQSLPVSRIEAIWTMNDKARSKLLASVQTFSDAPISAELVKTAPGILIAVCPDPNPSDVAIPRLSDDMRERKKRYDQMLGMFAFIRNTEKYYSGQTLHYADVSRSYLQTLAALNPAIRTFPFSDEDRRVGEYFAELLVGRPTDASLIPIVEIIRKGSNFDRSSIEKIIASQKGLLSEDAATTVERAFRELFDDGFKQCLQILEQAPTLGYYTMLAVLYRFHKRGSNDKVNLKNIFPDVMRDLRRAEIVLAILGQYYGYALLPKDETIETIAPAFLPIVGRQHAIKFDLKEMLDRITIETVFQISHNGTLSGGMRFEYLRSQPAEHVETLTVGNRNMVDESFTVEGTRIRHYRVFDEIEQLGQLLRATYETGRRPFYLAMYAARRTPQFVLGIHIKEKLTVEIDIDLAGLLTELPNIVRTDAHEIRACIEADKRFVHQMDK